MLATPRNTQDTRAPSWHTDLDAYLASHGLTPSKEGPSLDRRAELIAALKASPKDPEPWFAFLDFEEQHQTNVTSGLPGRLHHEAGGVTLYHLYFWATQLVPRSSNQQKEEYIKLWIGYARHQWARNQDDARDTFKTLKNQQIGDRCGELYVEWAALEQSVGNTSKALGILAKGMKENAQPAALLEQQKMEIQSGTFDLKSAHAFTETITVGLVAASTSRMGPPQETPAAAALAQGSQVKAKPTHSLHITFDKSVDEAAAQHNGMRHPISRAKSFTSQGCALTRTDSAVTPGPMTDGTMATATVHSSSSRSTCSATGTLPFTSGPAASYKSSSTEHSQASQQEEDTISCKAGPRGDALSQVPESAQQNKTGSAAGGANNTAGLRRFGFKSRALRVGGTSGPLDLGPSHQSSAAGTASRLFSTPAAASRDPQQQQQQAQLPSAIAAGEHGLSRKRGAELQAAAPDPGVGPALASSPKLAATLVSGQQQKSLPGWQAQAQDNRYRSSSGSDRTPISVRAAAAAPGHADGKPAGEETDDSVPLVCSKLAAKLAMDKCTPMGRRPSTGSECSRDTVVLVPSSQPSPVEGQLPNSLQSTPDALGTGSHLASSSTAAAASQPSHQTWDEPEGDNGDEESPGLVIPPTVVLNPRQTDRGSKPSTTSLLEGHTGRSTVKGSGLHENAVGADGQLAKAGDKASLGRTTSQPASARQPLRPVPSANTVPPVAAPRAPPAVSEKAPIASSKSVATAVAAGTATAAPHSVHRPAADVPLPGAVPAAAILQQQQRQQQQQQAAAPKHTRPREDAQTVYVQGTRYTKLECVGRGGSSKVFKVMGPSCKIYALKRIRLQGRDPEAAAGFIDEIELLQRLVNKPNIIQLIESQVFTNEGLIYMVQEYGEIDLARLLAKHEAARQQGVGGGDMDENFIRLYWQQMLRAVNIVHGLRIVHSDLKPANFLLVEGQLKLIDFGIAKAIQNDTTSIARETQVGTLNYMSPEAILGGPQNILGGPPMKVGRASDIWSLGCILYQMVFGRTPFAELPFLQKMHAICDDKFAIKYPPCSNPDVVRVIQRCLDRDPKSRISMEELLQDPFLHPNRARVPPPVAPQPVGGLSEDQLRQLIAQVAQAGASGPADIDKLTRQLMTQLTTTSAAGGRTGGNSGPDTRDTTGMSTSSSIDSGLASAAVVATAAAAGREQLQQGSSRGRNPHPQQQQHPNAPVQAGSGTAHPVSSASARGHQGDAAMPAAAAVSTAPAARGTSSGVSTISTAAADGVSRVHAAAVARAHPSISSRHTSAGAAGGRQPDASAARRTTSRLPGEHQHSSSSEAHRGGVSVTTNSARLAASTGSKLVDATAGHQHHSISSNAGTVSSSGAGGSSNAARSSSSSRSRSVTHAHTGGHLHGVRPGGEGMAKVHGAAEADVRLGLERVKLAEKAEGISGRAAAPSHPAGQ